MQKLEKGKAMEPGSKLTEKSVFETLCALPHAICPMLYHPEFRHPPSEFQFLSSDLCFLPLDTSCLFFLTLNVEP